jgi:hypothetical protein
VFGGNDLVNAEEGVACHKTVTLPKTKVNKKKRNHCIGNFNRYHDLSHLFLDWTLRLIAGPRLAPSSEAAFCCA